MPRVLWIDDDGLNEDGQNRFVFETYRIEADGWEVDWALSVNQAAAKLAEITFDAVILDQMLRGDEVEDVEDPSMPKAGCRLLYWLRGAEWPDRPDPWASLSESNPRSANMTAPVVLVSAFFDDEILRLTRRASQRDREIELLSKPVDLEALRSFLGAASDDGEARQA